MGLPRFLPEPKRRRVLCVAAVRACAAWITTQPACLADATGGGGSGG
jgi:hypothetical protein